MPKKPVGNQFVSRVLETVLANGVIDTESSTQLEKFVDDVGERSSRRSLTGTLHPIEQTTLETREPALFYTRRTGDLFVGDALTWLTSLAPNSVDLIFADPPYNIGKADWDEFESHDAYIEWTLEWIGRASRALKPTGTLYVCGWSEILADIRRPAMKHFTNCRWLVWHYKNKANMGRGWGRSHESILYLTKGSDATFNTDEVRIPYSQHTLKYPLHPQATSSQYAGGRNDYKWSPNPHGAKPKDVFEIPVTSNGMKEKTPHPTQKPEELLRRLILASSNEGDVVLDPFIGSGTTLVCAEQLGRRWGGCELNPDYARWAVARLESIPKRSVRGWIDFDLATARRRESIR